MPHRPIRRRRPGAIASAVLTAALVCLAPAPAPADEDEGARIVFGEDVYAAGDAAEATGPSARSAFVAGGDVELAGRVARDAHVAAFDADIDAPVEGDLYAAAAIIAVESDVGGDATLAAYRASLAPEASVGGNLRAMAREVSVDGPVAGSVLVASGTLRIAGTVSGDVLFAGRELEFGPDARIEGRLDYRAPEAADIPASVIPAERVGFTAVTLEMDGVGEEAAEAALGFEVPSALTIAAAVAGALLALVLVGVLFLGLAPRTVEGLRAEIEARLWRAFGFGLIGLATLLGLVPLAIITIVGLPLIPVLLPVLAFVAAFAWLLGAYTLAHRVFRSFGAGLQTMGARLLVFVVGVIVLAALNAVPVLGWIINGFASLIGFGGLQMRLVERLDRATPKREASAAT